VQACKHRGRFVVGTQAQDQTPAVLSELAHQLVVVKLARGQPREVQVALELGVELLACAVHVMLASQTRKYMLHVVVRVQRGQEAFHLFQIGRAQGARVNGVFGAVSQLG
jgi:hypothetical protein